MICKSIKLYIRLYKVIQVTAAGAVDREFCVYRGAPVRLQREPGATLGNPQGTLGRPWGILGGSWGTLWAPFGRMLDFVENGSPFSGKMCRNHCK